MILNKETAQKKLRRMALQVAERNIGTGALVLIGIKENGMVIARAMAELLAEVYPGKVELVSLSLNKKQPKEITLGEEININGKHVLLIDDVANSGRTMLYAIKPLLDQYPAQLETLALVERTHKLFPIAINYCGISVSTTPQQMIKVEVDDAAVMGAHIQ